MKFNKTIWFVSEVYFPDEQGTAFYATDLAEGLARDYDVRVLCSFPTVTARGIPVSSKEVRNRVVIERCRGTTFDKDRLILRLFNLVTSSVAILLTGLCRVRKGDLVIGVTAPPSMPFIAKIICMLKRAKCILWLEDVYPEILVGTGLIRPQSPLDRFIGLLNKMLYRSVNQIVVLGRDMHALVARKMNAINGHPRIINCWADTGTVWPLPKKDNSLLKDLKIEGKFIVSCVGNMGRAQAIEMIFQAAENLRNNPLIHFLFIGSGAKRTWMEQEIAHKSLTNITIIGQRPRSEQINFLNACDISIVSLLPGITGAAVPSRLYNIMAAGKPVISLASPDSEVSLVVNEEEIGWVVPPHSPGELVETVLNAMVDKERLKAMGLRAYAAAITKYSREKIVRDYYDLIEKVG
jgi:glycosyltransferase involved in cell wall biosynthesis